MEKSICRICYVQMLQISRNRNRKSEMLLEQKARCIRMDDTFWRVFVHGYYLDGGKNSTFSSVISKCIFLMWMIYSSDLYDLNRGFSWLLFGFYRWNLWENSLISQIMYWNVKIFILRLQIKTITYFTLIIHQSYYSSSF